MRLPMGRGRGGRPVAARLERVRQGVAPAPDDSPRRLRWRWLGLFTLALLVAFGGLLLALGRLLDAPPPGAQRQKLPGGLRVRLIDLTSAAPHRYRYEPPAVPARGLFAAAGHQLGQPPLDVTTDLPAGALCLWLWADRPGVMVGDGIEVTDDAGRVYRVSERLHPFASGQRPWGQRSCLWLALTRFDRTARQFTWRVPLPPYGEARFVVPGPGEARRGWNTPTSYPLAAGDETASVRLHSLRPADPARMANLLSLAGVAPPHEDLLLADLDVTERASAEQPGEWRLTVDEALTDGGEALTVVREAAGLTWLTAGRPPDFGAVRLTVTARKVAPGEAVLVFRGLTPPAKVGEAADWEVPADEPFPACAIVAKRAERTASGTLLVRFEGQAPAGAEILSLTQVDGLDQAGRRITAVFDRTAALKEKRAGPSAASWTWSQSLRIAGDTTKLALAYRILFRRTTAQVSCELTGRVQGGPVPVMGLGLLLEPPRQVTAASSFKVATVLRGTKAAEANLQPGDEVLRVDGLPPAMLARTLLRHGPGEAVEILFRRDGKTYRSRVGLDPLDVAPAAPPEPAPLTPPAPGEVPIETNRR